MAAMCSIVPEYILADIVNAGKAPEHVIHACQSTIEETKSLRNVRVQRGPEIPPSEGQRPLEGIIPSYIHESLARHAPTEEQRDASARTLAQDTERRADENHRIPRNDMMIKEGGVLITKEKDPSSDANECYIGFGKVYDFYFQFFNRDSIDGRGLPLIGFVHYGDKYQNAFWYNNEMVFSEGDGVIMNGFTDELDVIGHELSHGVVEYTSPLAYTFQSGALNESFADVFGAMIKQWGEDPKNPQTADQANWLIGEGIWGKTVNGQALRSMKAPGTAYDDPKVGGKDRQPGHWKDFQDLSEEEDAGGVHINSGIPNHAFYLACTAIGGYSWETAGPVWYKALTSKKLGQNASFKQFADVTISVAGDHKPKIQEAWNQVGYPFDGQ